MHVEPHSTPFPHEQIIGRHDGALYLSKENRISDGHSVGRQVCNPGGWWIDWGHWKSGQWKGMREEWEDKLLKVEGDISGWCWGGWNSWRVSFEEGGERGRYEVVLVVDDVRDDDACCWLNRILWKLWRWLGGNKPPQERKCTKSEQD